MKTGVKREAYAVTNQGYGEVMTYRHMDLGGEQSVKGFMLGVITHHYDHTSTAYKVDPFDAASITEASRDLAAIFGKYATME